MELDTEVFRRVTRQRPGLPHPTARAFKTEEWDAVFRSQGLCRRDRNLAAAALWIGAQIGLLRFQYEAKLFAGLNRSSAIALTAAFANREYRALEKQLDRARLEAFRSGAAHLDSLAHAEINVGLPGNKFRPDDIVTHVVDVLPHWLERASQLSDAQKVAEGDFGPTAVKIGSILSIERGYRDLWQEALWEGWALRAGDAGLSFEPADVEVAILWELWVWRHQSLMSQHSLIDMDAARRAHELGIRSAPPLPLTIVGPEKRPGRKKGFIFGASSARDLGQMGHRAEEIALETSYIEFLLDIPLPNLKDPKLTCRCLQRAWAVLRDAASVAAKDLPRARFKSKKAVEQHALITKREELRNANSGWKRVTHRERLSNAATDRANELVRASGNLSA